MFGLFKRGAAAECAPDDPMELKVAIEIDRPAAEVYALLDWADERNQMRARGNIVRRECVQPEIYRLWYDRAPDLNFLFTVVVAEPGRKYEFRGDIVPPVGRRLGAVESYALEPIGDDCCRVTFANTIHHVPGLTRAEWQDELAKSSSAAAGGLVKLKLQAEQGVAALEDFERELGQR
jgi:hypothetical protein